MTNYNFSNANIATEYSEVTEKYIVKISVSDFWKSITNEEYKQYIQEGLRENTPEGLISYFIKGNNIYVMRALSEATGIDFEKIGRFEIIEDSSEENTEEHTMKSNEYTEMEKFTEMGLMGPSLEELGMTEEEYYGLNDYTIHPNERYTDAEDDALFGLTPEIICQISEVDEDVFDSHPNYNSALHVAKQIAEEVNAEIQKAYFNGEYSIAEDLRYDYDTNGTYCQMYEFEGTYSKVTGELILSEFEIYDDSYFERY